MSQPIIDPDKVNAWTESMRAAFGTSSLGTWLILGCSVVFIAFVAITAWQVSREPKHRI